MSAPTKNLFESMTRRRVSCPQVTQQLWDTIRTIRNTRQVSTAERIQKLMLKEFGVNEEEVTRQLNHCVRDGLLEVTKRTVSKGNNAGSEQEWFKLPTLKLKADDYDWYCFDCHRAGDVICCTKNGCHRVYHLACISSSELPRESFICHVCRMCQPSPSKFQMKRSKLNRLLGHPLAKLKSKYPLTLKDQRLPPPNKNILVSDRVAQALTPPALPPPDESESWRSHLLIAREMNLTIVEEKIDRHRYRLLEQFHADCLNILHNMVIYNGVDSAVADIARQMVRDCVEDLKEIRQCVDCYKMSHGQKKQWFAKPCRKPHELVYAKQPGQPYWPAKVMKMDGDQYDVRLFGAQHPRVLVPKSLIRPISVNIHALQGKRSSAWNRACEELKKHQELLEKARIETHNFTVFVESSSSEDSESLDSETERRLERDYRLSKLKLIIDKTSGNSSKTKQKGVKGRRSSSVAPTPVVGEKKRGRPKLQADGASIPTSKPTVTPKAGARRKRKETFDSSDSLDSFRVGMDGPPKKNTDEIFDELLKSAPANPASQEGNKSSESSSRGGKSAEKQKTETKSAEIKKKKAPVKSLAADRKRTSTSRPEAKSDTLDSLDTMSSIDGENNSNTSTARKPASTFVSKKYTSTEESDSDDSDLASSSSTRKKTTARQRPLRTKKPVTESRSSKGKPSQISDDDDDDSSSTDSDSDSQKKPNGKPANDSSSLSSDSEEEEKTSSAQRRRGAVASALAKTAPKSPAKPDSSDSEKQKDSSESTDVEQSPAVKKPAPAKTKPAAAKPKKTPVRASTRNINKTEKKEEKETAESTDSETPLSAKRNKKIAEVRDILKKFTRKGSTDSNKSDSDSESNKAPVAVKTVTEKEPKVVGKGRPGGTGGSKKDVKEEVKEKEETLVSSSSQEPVTRSVSVQTEVARLPGLSPDLKHRADRISELEKELQLQAQTNRLLEMEFDKTKVLIDRMRSDHDDEIAEINTRHLSQISEIKKKQWCYNCETEAIYHCCWNTAYCSVECQQAHWQSEHKRVCRRKR